MTSSFRCLDTAINNRVLPCWKDSTCETLIVVRLRQPRGNNEAKQKRKKGAKEPAKQHTSRRGNENITINVLKPAVQLQGFPCCPAHVLFVHRVTSEFCDFFLKKL